MADPVDVKRQHQDHNQLEIRNFSVEKLGAHPTGADLYLGREWILTTDNEKYRYNGTSVVQVGTSVGSHTARDLVSADFDASGAAWPTTGSADSAVSGSYIIETTGNNGDSHAIGIGVNGSGSNNSNAFAGDASAATIETAIVASASVASVTVTDLGSNKFRVAFDGADEGLKVDDFSDMGSEALAASIIVESQGGNTISAGDEWLVTTDGTISTVDLHVGDQIIAKIGGADGDTHFFVVHGEVVDLTPYTKPHKLTGQALTASVDNQVDFANLDEVHDITVLKDNGDGTRVDITDDVSVRFDDTTLNRVQINPGPVAETDLWIIGTGTKA